MNRARHNRGRYSKENSNKYKTLGTIIVLIIIIVIVVILKYTNQGNEEKIIAHEDSLEEANENIIIAEIEETPKEEPKLEDEVVPVDDMPNKMGIYKVVGKIVIDKIGIEKYILERTTENSLNLAVTKFEGTLKGPEINEVGNFMIMGHNYPKIFGKLKELNIGDEFYLVGKDGRKVTYTIYEKYSMNPESEEDEAKLISQETNGKRIATLITCNKGAFTRLILKAEEKIGGI